MYIQNIADGGRLSPTDRKLLREIAQSTTSLIQQRTGAEIPIGAFISFMNSKAMALANFCIEFEESDIEQLKSKYKIKKIEKDKYEVVLINSFDQTYNCRIEFKTDEDGKPCFDVYYSDEVCEYITTNGMVFLREVYEDGVCTFTLVDER